MGSVKKMHVQHISDEDLPKVSLCGSAHILRKMASLYSIDRCSLSFPGCLANKKLPLPMFNAIGAQTDIL